MLTSASDNQSWIQLQTVRSKRWILKVFDKLLHVSFHVDIGEIGHHVSDDFEAGVFGHFERLADRFDGMASVGVASYVLVDRLHADFEAGAAVGEHVAQVLFQAVVWTRLDRDADAFCFRFFAVFDGFFYAVARVAFFIIFILN